MISIAKSEENVITKVYEAFRDIPRPEEFIRGTCYCDECMEHNQILASHTPETISIEELGQPAWDPICFANDDAFVYYLPAMVRLAFETDYYIDQLLFHLNNPGRLDVLSVTQAKVLLEALWLMVEVKDEEIVWEIDGYALEEAIKTLEHLIR